MRIVLDTNVLVSAVLSPLGLPAQVLELVLNRTVTLLVSHAILKEYKEVLHRKEFSFPDRSIDQLLRVIDLTAEKISVVPSSLKLPDPDDLPFLDCAIQGKAGALVTGNKKDYPISVCGDARTVSPVEFLRLLDESQK